MRAFSPSTFSSLFLVASPGRKVFAVSGYQAPRPTKAVSTSFRHSPSISLHCTSNMSDSKNTVDNSNADMAELIKRKKALRKTIRARLKDLDKDTIQKESQKVWERLFALPQYQAAQSVGLFLSMPKGEIDTDPALRHAMEHNKKIYVPEVGKDFELADMELVQVIMDEDNNKINDRQVLFHENWPRNKWGIPEPPPSMPIVTAKPGDIDVLVVPGLAFDRQGDRLGQGKGYYDRFIERMCSDKNENPPFLVAVGLQAQVVDENIPVATYDRRMDMVLLPDETIIVTK